LTTGRVLVVDYRQGLNEASREDYSERNEGPPRATGPTHFDRVHSVPPLADELLHYSWTILKLLISGRPDPPRAEGSAPALQPRDLLGPAGALP
jgi:hypothetical protein